MPEKDIEAITELPHLNDLQASDQGNLKVSLLCWIVAACLFMKHSFHMDGGLVNGFMMQIFKPKPAVRGQWRSGNTNITPFNLPSFDCMWWLP